MARPETLPDFQNPPVIEVVLGIQFERLSKFQTVHAGYLWDEFRAEFPRAQEHSALDPTFETFGTRPGAEGLKLELISGPPPFPRLWFLNDAETQLIQFQPDRFIHNWRKVEEGDEYPRYEAIKTRYLEELETLIRFCGRRELGELRPNQCEITYVNHITSENGEDLCAHPEKVFQFLGAEAAPPIFTDLEGARFQLRFTLFSDDKQRIGRLHVNAQPAVTEEGAAVIALTLTARGSPTAPTLEAASQFLDLGRDKIVRGFTRLTTEAMHRRWRRR